MLNSFKAIVIIPFITPIYPFITPISGTNTRRILEDFWYVFYVVSTIYADIFSLLRICSRSLWVLD